MAKNELLKLARLNDQRRFLRYTRAIIINIYNTSIYLYIQYRYNLGDVYYSISRFLQWEIILHSFK